VSAFGSKADIGWTLGNLCAFSMQRSTISGIMAVA
jgi:hypothetical protein